MLALYAQLLPLVVLPLIVASGGAVVGWRSFAHPWLFLILALVALYVIYGLVMYFLDPNFGRGAGYMVSMRVNAHPGESKYLVQSTRGDEVRYFLSEYVRQVLVFLVLSVPTLWGLSRLFIR